MLIMLSPQHLMYFAGHINYTTDRSLSLTQAMKTLFIRNIYEKLNINTNYNKENFAKLLSLWLYFLLSEKKFNELTKELNKIDENNIINSLNKISNDDNAVTVAKYCYLIFSEKDIDEALNNKMKQITDGKLYINKKEWLNYAIAKVYDNMNQKPILNHIVDTIFIIRKAQEINNYTELISDIKYLDIFYDRNIFYNKICFIRETII